jgi:hypothetical protein
VSGELGRASYELDADLGPLRRNIREAGRDVNSLERDFDALTAISEVTAEAMRNVKLTLKQAGESDASAEAIIAGVRGISEESRDAARELDRVRITETQASESSLAGERIKHDVKDIGDEADRTKRKLAEVRLAGGRNGTGVGPIGSGYGRVGLLGSAIGAGVLTAPAAGPAALGVLAAALPLMGTVAGSAGVLALAFDNVGKAIGGDKKAFDSLTPAAKDFTVTVRSLHGWLEQLKQTAAGSLFPGLAAGLKDALSPGTLNAITVAVTSLGRALGQAGELWGKYFGSAEFQRLFGPLMQSAARTVDSLSVAALSLFDALGTLGRAAIPLTDWMTRGAAAGARLVDTWLHTEDATGGLSRAMDAAQTSLRLVGGLVGSLLNALGALSRALYPVSQVAVKDLTDGLNALARIIKNNQDGIREFVGGALAALVSAVKTAAPVVAALAHFLEKVVDAVGGWKRGFEIILSGILATKLVELVGGASKVATALATIGTDAATSAGEVSALRAGLIALSDPLVLGALAAVAAGIGALYLMNRSAGGVGSTAITQDMGNAGTTITRGKNGQYYAHLGGRYYPISPGQAQADIGLFGHLSGGDGLGPDAMRGAAATTQARPQTFTKAQLAALWVKAGGDPRVADTMASIAHAQSKGRSNATNTSNSDGSTDRGLWQINSVHGYVPSASYNALQNARQAVSVYNSQGLGAWTTYTNGAYSKYTAGTAGSSSAFGAMPDFTKNLGTKQQVSPIPSVVTDLLDRVSANASKAKQFGNVGGTARRFMQNELDELQAADKALHAKLTSAKGKDATTLKHTLTIVENKIRDVQSQIKKTFLVTECRLIPLPQKKVAPAPTREAVAA